MMMKRTPIWLFLIIISLALMTACASVFAATPSDDGVIEVVMRDYKFEPEVIRVQAGDTVRLVLHNEGNKMHELMIGRNVNIHEGLSEGFAEDFFAGITPTITGPGMVMGMEGMDMGGMDMGDDEHAEDTMDEMSDMGMADEHDEGAMDDMTDMGEDAHTDEMEMDAAEHDEGMAMGGDEHTDEAEHNDEAMPAGEFGAFQMPLMDAHEGLMVMIDPPAVAPGGEPTIVEFTVPEDKVGTWTFACFQERGQHYDDGMEGTLIVEP